MTPDSRPSPVHLVVVNARIRTGDAARPWADALAVRDGRLLAVGSSAALRKLAGPETTVIDARGAQVHAAAGLSRLTVDDPADFDIGLSPDSLQPASAGRTASTAAGADEPVRLRIRGGRPVASGA